MKKIGDSIDFESNGKLYNGKVRERVSDDTNTGYIVHTVVPVRAYWYVPDCAAKR